MKIIRTFEEYQQKGIVRKITPDVERAKNLQLEARRKEKLLVKNVQQTGIEEDNANDYVEYCYNIIMFLIRAKMYLQGFTSAGKGAHEAEVSFAQKLHFLEEDIRFLDQLRYFRNGILYYGKRFDKEYAQKVIRYTKRISKHIKKQ